MKCSISFICSEVDFFPAFVLTQIQPLTSDVPNGNSYMATVTKPKLKTIVDHLIVYIEQQPTPSGKVHKNGIEAILIYWLIAVSNRNR